jgi:hypothetical protein
MQDIQKYAVQNKYIRTVHGEDILALASFAYTSNAPPPEMVLLDVDSLPYSFSRRRNGQMNRRKVMSSG